MRKQVDIVLTKKQVDWIKNKNHQVITTLENDQDAKESLTGRSL